MPNERVSLRTLFWDQREMTAEDCKYGILSMRLTDRNVCDEGYSVWLYLFADNYRIEEMQLSDSKPTAISAFTIIPDIVHQDESDAGDVECSVCISDDLAPCS